MSYSEENGLVVLRMTKEDYDRLLIILGTAERALPVSWKVPMMPEFLNRLNEGNPNYTPYQVEEKK